MQCPLITIVIPSLNQADYLDECLESIFNQNIQKEVFLVDGGSTDNTLKIIDKWKNKLHGYRISKDDGQAAAINYGVSLGKADYVCWLNSDDYFLPNKLKKLIDNLELNKKVPVAYGKVLNYFDKNKKFNNVKVEPFSFKTLTKRCFISQPGTVIRRSVWESVKGLDETLYLSMDYDLWWKIYSRYGEFNFIDESIAVNRIHSNTKTAKNRFKHYQESMTIVKKYNNFVPIIWWLRQPYSVWLRSLLRK